MTSKILFANNATSTLAGAITNVALVANLAPGSGALFPAPIVGQYFCLTFTDAATGLVNEIVHVTDVTGDTITMVRAQEGTAAAAWQAGDIAAELITAGQLAAMNQQGVASAQPARVATLSTDPAVTVADYAIGFNRTAGVADTPIALPPNAGVAIGQEFEFQDLAGNFNAHPITVTPNSGSISGRANVVCNTDFGTLTVKYYGTNLWGYQLS